MRHRDITPVAGGVRLLDDLEGETVRLVPPPPRGIVAVAAAPDGRSDVPGRHREQLSHDIRHELGTVMMLASLLADSLDVGSAGRRRADQLVVEARWLAALQDAVDDAATAPVLEPIRVDLCAGQTVAVLELSCATAIDLTASAVWAARTSWRSGERCGTSSETLSAPPDRPAGSPCASSRSVTGRLLRWTTTVQASEQHLRHRVHGSGHRVPIRRLVRWSARDSSRRPGRLLRPPPFTRHVRAETAGLGFASMCDSFRGFDVLADL